VMAPTRMKLRVRRRDNASVGSSDASPDSKCPICLDRFNNLAYLDRCLHRFCFPCIQEWSHNKAECPLCKQPFASILHSVRAEDDFKEYTLRPPPANSSVAATVAMVAAMASARETVAFRRALYRSGTRVRGVAGVGHQGQQQRDITADSFRRNPVHLNRLRPWLRRELTVLYGAHEEELRQFLLARTDHFLHELVSFARSPLSLENYDLQAVYEPPAAAMELDGVSSSSDSSSVIAISEGEEEERRAGGRSEETRAAHDDIIQTGSNLSLAAWDDETPGPSYSSAEPSCSLASLLFSPAPPEAANEEEGEKREEEECEEECLIVGYKKPIAERTPELVQLSSDSEEEEEKKKKEEEEDTAEKLPPLATATPPLSYLPTIPPSTSGTYRDEQDDKPTENDGEAAECRSRGRSWSGSSGRSGNSVCTLSPATPPGDSERRRERASWRERKQPAGEGVREKRRRKRSRRARERSGDGLRKSGTLYNPNRSIYPAMMRHRSHSPSPFHSSVESGSPLPPSPSDSTWEYHCSQVSPLTSSVSSPSSSSSSPLCSSPQPSSQTPPTPSLSPGDGGTRHGEKPGGKRKYKSRHLDNSDKDPTWRPSSDNHREERRERRETERRKRGREEGRRRQRLKRDAHRAIGGDG
uniref:E3 ubiquitin-protein ligase Topors n=1 Tax=Dicentrarchus labrax TaxID=13489 RepID=A0A8P4K1U7_DICLA